MRSRDISEMVSKGGSDDVKVLDECIKGVCHKRLWHCKNILWIERNCMVERFKKVN